MAVRNKYDEDREQGQAGIAQFAPQCTSGGEYAPKQCLTGSLCYCSDAKGNKIFGEALPGQHQDCGA